MIEICKHGNTVVNKKYLAACPKCDCEFSFTKGDYEGNDGEGVSISCPECEYTWAGKYIGNISFAYAIIDRIDTKTSEEK